MTAAEFRVLLAKHAPQDLLGLCVKDDEVPFAFDKNPDCWTEFRETFGAKFRVNPSDIRVVGSGRHGISAKPGKNLKTFIDTSDIDVVVISAALFDNLWQKLLEAAYPREGNLHLLAGHLRELQSEVYTGFLTPAEFRFDRLKFGEHAAPVYEFRADWFSALKRASNLPIRRHENMEARVYRTWAHAERYHLDSIASLQRSLNK